AIAEAALPGGDDSLAAGGSQEAAASPRAAVEPAPEADPRHLRDLEPQGRVGECHEHVLQVRLIDEHHDPDRHTPDLVVDHQVTLLVAVDDGGDRPAAGPGGRRVARPATDQRARV